jgi:hypothetical protein
LTGEAEREGCRKVLLCSTASACKRAAPVYQTSESYGTRLGIEIISDLMAHPTSE